MKSIEKTNKLIQFLEQNMNHQTFMELHTKLGISRRMLTVLLRNPERITIYQGNTISDLLGIGYLEFLLLINPE